MKIAIFHGNELWVLRGLAIDIEKALCKAGVEVKRYETNFSAPPPPPAADWFFFVHHSQMDKLLGAWGYEPSLIKKCICIFTHFNYENINFKLLAEIKLISHMSSHQMAISIGNGLNSNNSILMPLGVDPSRHFPAKQLFIDNYLERNYPQIQIKEKGSYIGFCTRYRKTATYTSRKNYACLFSLVKSLIAKNKKVLILGDGWEESFNQYKNLIQVNPPYKEYNIFYNLMKVFVSVTSYDGGPIPLLESMACGVPPVITNSGFAPDVINSKELGFLFQPFAPIEQIIDLIQKCENLQFDKFKLRDASANFSFDSYAKKLMRTLTQV